jgi:hypothetical protein
LYLRLVDLDDNPVYLNDVTTNDDGWFAYDDEVLSGENMIALRLTKEQCEQIYILEFCFGDEHGPDTKLFNKPRFKKLLITSIVFNDFVSSKAIFDKEISFSEWYKLHDKYAKFNPDDLHININLDNHEFTTTTEKEIIRVSNEKY